MDKIRAQYLLEKYHNNSLTADERAEFVLLLHHPAFEFLRSEWLEEIWPDDEDEIIIVPNSEKVFEDLLTKISLKTKSFSKTYKFVGIAAFFLVTLSTILWFTKIHNFHNATQDMGENYEFKRRVATIEVAGGGKIILDSSQNEIIIDKFLTYANGQSVFKNEKEITSEIKLSVPEGKVYSVRLSDGTLVKLNAMSTLIFPGTFSNRERHVKLFGEGYFEVKSRESDPFYVSTRNDGKNLSVRVTGTRFNVSAYPSDSIHSVSLFEGRVDVNNRKLLPNRAFYLSEKTSYIDEFDRSVVLGWVNNEFRFDKDSLYGILHKLERWYGIKFKIEVQNEDVNLSGAISKDKDLETLLKVISNYANVKFATFGQTITVKKK